MSQSFRVIEDDPVLGKYIKHYTTHRMRLLLQAGILYGIAVVIIQVLTLSLTVTSAAIVVPILYTLVSLPLGWYIVHLWNREVILFEKGFTYRQGSTMAVFFYDQIVSLRVKAERVVSFGFIRRDLYECQMLTNHDEKMTLTNLYGEIAELLERIERLITQARRPALNQSLARGERVFFGTQLVMTVDGLEDETSDQVLAWADYAGFRVEKGHLIILSSQAEWGIYPVVELDNVMQLVAVLKERG